MLLFTGHAKISEYKQSGIMALHNFTLTLSGVTCEIEGLEDAIFNSGCDDALICAYGNSALVGLSDIAEMTNMSRQAIAMLKDGTRGSGDFPCPIQRINGQSPLWDWGEVADWLSTNGRLKRDSERVVNARVLSK